MAKFVRSIAGLAVIAAGVGWVLTGPAPLDAAFVDIPQGDLAAGQQVFAAGGCASCHAAPGAEGDAKLVLAGGTAFPSEFGTFYAPNISPDPEAGIGAWSFEEFALALTQGVSPQGKHYYPAFPYTAYSQMQPTDVADLFAYISQLPSDGTASKKHDVGFPFNIRRAVGGWKLLYMPSDFVISGDLDPEVARGRYLVEALAHCGECHTPRSALGGLKRGQWLAGAPNPSGKGKIPNITPAEHKWSADELVTYFTSGFTPEYDSAGGEMAEVVSNLAQLPDADRAAIAAYIKALPTSD
ncbi:diacylglycerol kinase [Sulfitobacter sp. SK012]|uniref:cytochrome c n=1 Tax=Sulfitobacter sp. SK012 TaxID=1389005 RepID=UPI000E0AB406|nr:cytochrome c [Sulfitobacter sp. SK012]AXI46802.1 diacylglycerol kinase [Sulfitobacter sp. SK012]